MALSNWAAAAWNERGEPVFARAKFGDVRVELLKDHLDVGDEGAWREGDPLIKPWVMQVYEGCLEYRMLRIAAGRARSQLGIFFWVWEPRSDRMLLGIGAYAFEYRDDDDGEYGEGRERYVGIKEETFREFLRWLDTVHCCKAWHLFSMPPPPRIKRFWWYNQGTLYIYELLGGRMPDDAARDEELVKKLQRLLI